MAPHSRKRRAPVEEEGEEEEESINPTQTQRNGRRNGTPEYDDEMDEAEEQDQSSGSLAQLSKGFVRYALACEYARISIKRQDVNQKVLGSHSRQFKHVFDAANAQLMDTFGMHMVELPNAEKVTERQKRAAAAAGSQSKSSNQWVLQTILPAKFRTPDIVSPSDIPTAELESAYIGFYTMVIALITIAGGRLSESRLDRFLRRMNANMSTPIDTTDKTLAKMVKDGYIVKIKESLPDGEQIDYMVGTRGKVEVGRDGVEHLVRTVFGDSVEDLDQRLKRTLELNEPQQRAAVGGDEASTQGAGRKAGRPRRREDDE